MTKNYKAKREIKYCMLEEDKLCDNCLECNTCDVDPKKICNNCAKCIDSETDYKIVEIDDLIIEKDLKKKLQQVDQQKSHHKKH